MLAAFCVKFSSFFLSLKCVESPESQRRHIHFGLVSARKLNEFIIHKLIWLIAEQKNVEQWNGDIAQFSQTDWKSQNRMCHTLAQYISIRWLLFFFVPSCTSLIHTHSIHFSCFSFSIYYMGVFDLTICCNNIHVYMHYICSIAFQ